jgi:hypothetical protein
MWTQLVLLFPSAVICTSVCIYIWLYASAWFVGVCLSVVIVLQHLCTHLFRARTRGSETQHDQLLPAWSAPTVGSIRASACHRTSAPTWLHHPLCRSGASALWLWISLFCGNPSIVSAQSCPVGSDYNSSSAQCVACPGGMFCVGGVNSALPCPIGLFCPVNASYPVACPAGSYCGAAAAAPTACSSTQPLSNVAAASDAACMGYGTHQLCRQHTSFDQWLFCVWGLVVSTAFVYDLGT